MLEVISFFFFDKVSFQGSLSWPLSHVWFTAQRSLSWLKISIENIIFSPLFAATWSNQCVFFETFFMFVIRKNQGRRQQQAVGVGIRTPCDITKSCLLKMHLEMLHCRSKFNQLKMRGRRRKKKVRER